MGPLTCHRLAAACLTLAVKWQDDDTMSNADYSKVCGMTLQALSRWGGQLSRRVWAVPACLGCFATERPKLRRDGRSGFRYERGAQGLDLDDHCCFVPIQEPQHRLPGNERALLSPILVRIGILSAHLGANFWTARRRLVLRAAMRLQLDGSVDWRDLMAVAGGRVSGFAWCERHLGSREPPAHRLVVRHLPLVGSLQGRRDDAAVVALCRMGVGGMGGECGVQSGGSRVGNRYARGKGGEWISGLAVDWSKCYDHVGGVQPSLLCAT